MKLSLVSGRADPHPDEDDKPFWQHRRWQLTAVTLVVAVFTGVAALVVGGGDGGVRAAVLGPSIGGLGPDGSRPQQCRTDDSRQAVPTTPPRDVAWWPLNGARAPRSASAGPLKETGPLRWCFAHTPMGAVMAANVIPRQMSGPDWRTVTRQQLIPGLSRDYFEAMRASIADESLGQTTTRLAGFAVVGYSPTTAAIRILVRQGGTVYVSLDYTVDWDGVDWKLRPLSVGGLYTNVTPVVSLTGFVLWKQV